MLHESTRITADRGQLKRIFENPYRNAIEHGRDDTDISVTISEIEGGVSVADDGVGILPEDRERILR